MNAIANFATWVWDRIVVFVKALNRALAAAPPNEGVAHSATPTWTEITVAAAPPNEGVAHLHDDTVFQPRDF